MLSASSSLYCWLSSAQEAQGGEWEKETASDIAIVGCLNTGIGRLGSGRREAEF
jgi:hypothetical protein